MLSIREDTAKYLLNLDLNSAFYDAKTRSMRENPHAGKDASEAVYVGDNFIRQGGDVSSVNALQSFVWESHDRGNEDINLLANPSQAEKLFAEFQSRKEQLKSQKKNAILERYGGSDVQDEQSVIPAALRTAQTESYVEYAEDGRVVKGIEEAAPKTKYAEDVYELNHTSVWGSYWHDGHWGYVCCHQLMRNAFCTGHKGRELAAESRRRLNREEGGEENEAERTAREEKAREEEEKAREEERRRLLRQREEDQQALAGLSFGSNSNSSTTEKEKDKTEEEKDADGFIKPTRLMMKRKEREREREEVAEGSDSEEDGVAASSASASTSVSGDSSTVSKKRKADRAARRERKVASKAEKAREQAKALEDAKLAEWREERKAVDSLEDRRKKKGYNVEYDSKAVTEEEMEAYHRGKRASDDPLRDMKDVTDDA